MKFIFKADAIIEADDLEDCYLQLSGHFLSIEHSDMEYVGTIEIHPMREEDEKK